LVQVLTLALSLRFHLANRWAKG